MNIRTPSTDEELFTVRCSPFTFSQEIKPMSTITQTHIETLLNAFTNKEMSTLMNAFAEDAIFVDPHYPEPQVQGKAAIQQGFEFAFNTIKQPGFSIRHFWANDHTGAAEVDTHHIFQDGNEVRFPQLFVFEMRDNLLTRFQAYVPYPPPAQP
jgi:ketosteroid isomerase-like protein